MLKVVREGSTYNTRPVLFTTGLLGRLDNLVGDDRAVGSGDGALFKLAGNTFADQVSQSQANLHDLGRRDGRRNALVPMAW